jgi:hypothetical protein
MIGELILSAADNRNPGSQASRLRARRFRRFSKLLVGVRDHVSILDVGGTPEFWVRHREELPVSASITLLNQSFDDCKDAGDLRYVVGDARRLDMFADFEFDMCFSNSVIEHVGGAADQKRMAREIERVARGYFVQTPNKWFPIEPHFLVPGWQFVPWPIRAWLLERRDWGWMKRAAGRESAIETVRSIRLLTASSLRALFPGAFIDREKFGPLTKSLIAIRHAR